MNIREFSNAVGLIALNYPTVQEYSEGDIYNYLNTGEHKYPCIFLTIESVEEGELNSQTLSGSLFYVDRLLNDSSNRLMVQTAAISTLQILTGKINDNISGEMEVGMYQPFTEKFADWCAGAFCEFSFTYITDSECGEYDELVLNVRKNGVYDILGYEKIVVSVPSGEGGVTEEWVENYSYSKQEVDSKLSKKADKTEIPSLTGYATELWVQNQGYLTEHQPLKTINGQSIVGEGNIEIEGGSGVTIEQVDAEIDSKLTGYATKEELNSKADASALRPLEGRIGALNQEVQNKADKSELPDMSNYATKSELNSKANTAYVISLDGRIGAVEQAVQNKADKSEIPSLDGYATLAEVQGLGYITVQEVDSKLTGYITHSEIPDPSNLATKDEIPSLTGYATQSWVEGKGYTTLEEVQGQGYLTEHQDISGKVDKTSIWTGTEAEWNALSTEQKASYTIALVR